MQWTDSPIVMWGIVISVVVVFYAFCIWLYQKWFPSSESYKNISGDDVGHEIYRQFEIRERAKIIDELRSINKNTKR